MSEVYTNARDYIKMNCEKLGGLMEIDEFKRHAASQMRKEDGLQELTEQLVSHECPFSSEQQAEIVKAMLESPDYKKVCDEHLVPLKFTKGKDYIKIYSENLVDELDEPRYAYRFKRNAASHMQKEDGIQEITKQVVANGHIGDESSFTSEQQAEIVKAMLESPEYKKVCDEHLVPLKFTNAKDYIKIYSKKLVDHIEEEAYDYRFKRNATSHMQKEDGIQEITKKVVAHGHIGDESSFTSEQQAEIVKALLESPEYKKVCDEHLVPLKFSNAKDYIAKYIEALGDFGDWSEEDTLRTARTMQKEDGIEQVTKDLVSHECPYTSEQQAQIVKALLESPEYKKLCDKHLVPLKLTDPPTFHIEKYTEHLGTHESWPDENKRNVARLMQKEDGIEQVTKQLVAHGDVFSSEQQARLVKALLESPDYKKACDEHLVPLAKLAKYKDPVQQDECEAAV